MNARNAQSRSQAPIGQEPGGAGGTALQQLMSLLRALRGSRYRAR